MMGSQSMSYSSIIYTLHHMICSRIKEYRLPYYYSLVEVGRPMSYIHCFYSLFEYKPHLTHMKGTMSTFYNRFVCSFCLYTKM